MNSNGFDLIAQQLLKQQRIMETLQAENRELRQQLADLRVGRGIFIEINGKRFALNAPSVSPASIQALPLESPSSIPQEASSSVTTTTSEEVSVETTESISPSQGKKQVETSTSTFLEEVMIDEFATALASSSTLSEDPINKQGEKKQEELEEEQKAALRRDLMGSYLLE